MVNSKINSYDFKNKDYINWIISILESEPSKMITEKTYSNILKNGSNLDKSNLSNLDKFANSLNSYANDNYINRKDIINYDSEYCVHFTLVLKVDNIFLLIESASSTYNSFVFISTIDNYDRPNYIDWDLYSNNKRPPAIEKIIRNLNEQSSNFNNYISNIAHSNLFDNINLSYSEKQDLIIKTFTSNLHSEL